MVGRIREKDLVDFKGCDGKPSGSWPRLVSQQIEQIERINADIHNPREAPASARPEGKFAAKA
jgi:hypothetical protein